MPGYSIMPGMGAEDGGEGRLEDSSLEDGITLLLGYDTFDRQTKSLAGCLGINQGVEWTTACKTKSISFAS